jgi:hypothetical protein
MEDGVEEYPLTGFDPEGEPYVRRTAEGRLWLGFYFMPPSWADEADCQGPGGPWTDFDEQLSRYLGVPVVWEDREWFRIDHPKADTVPAIGRFLVETRRRLDPGASESGPSTAATLRFRRMLFYGLAGLLGAWMLVRAILGVARLLSRAE